MVEVHTHNRVGVVIAGGGVAAIETLLALRSLCGERVELTLISSERNLLYRPVTVAEAFDRAQARTYDLDDLAREQAARTVWDSVVEVDAEHRSVATSGGERIPYDALVIATGATAHDPLAGALTFRGRADVPALRELLGELSDGRARSVALVLPSERMWSLPIYELALMTAAHVRDECRREVNVTIITPEAEPLELFGPTATAAISELLAAHRVTVRGSSLARLIKGRILFLAGGGEVHADRFIALPVLEGHTIRGLPHDAHGFIPVDAHGQVSGIDHVYAAGDITSFPLKQGGLAAQQADAVAEHIAAGLGVPITPTPFTPVLRGLLMTGGAPLYLRAQPHRLRRESTVAIEAKRSRSSVPSNTSLAGGQPLWWPPSKIAGRYLASHLATARPDLLTAELLTDRPAVPGPPVSDSEVQEALDLALLLADCDARWGDYASALNALAAAEALYGALPLEYEERRREWRAAAH